MKNWWTTELPINVISDIRQLCYDYVSVPEGIYILQFALHMKCFTEGSYTKQIVAQQTAINCHQPTPM